MFWLDILVILTPHSQVVYSPLCCNEYALRTMGLKPGFGKLQCW